MLRTLLVIDDYGEMVFLQTLLKKVGFDVEGIQSPRAVGDAILNFNPDLIILTANGKRINGVDISEGIKRASGRPRLVLLVPEQLMDRFQGVQLKNIDAFVGSPIKPAALLQKVAEVGGLDGALLAEKYAKLKSSQVQSEENLKVMSSDQDVSDENHLQIISGKIDEDNGPQRVGGEEDSAHKPRFSLKKEARDLTKTAGHQESDESTAVSQQPLSPEERSMRYQKALESMETPKFDGLPTERVREFHKQIRNQEKPGDLKPLEEERKEFVRTLFKTAKNKP